MEAEQLWQLDRCGGGRGQREGDECFAARERPRRLARSVFGDDELFPQALGVLARELARQRVEASHPLDGHEERFVAGEAGGRECRDLIAQVAFELLDVLAVDGLPAAQVRAPLGDLILERRAGRCRHAGLVFIQIAWSVWSTTFHRWRSAASCVRPSRVMR